MGRYVAVSHCAVCCGRHGMKIQVMTPAEAAQEITTSVVMEEGFGWVLADIFLNLRQAAFCGKS